MPTVIFNQQYDRSAETVLSDADYQEALQAQDAVNLSGVVHAFAAAVVRIWQEANVLKKGTAWVNSHPLVILYLDKLSDLSGHGREGTAFSKAYDYARLGGRTPASPMPEARHLVDALLDD